MHWCHVLRLPVIWLFTLDRKYDETITASPVLQWQGYLSKQPIKFQQLLATFDRWNLTLLEHMV